MRTGHAATRSVGPVARLEELARWWQAATQEARFQLYARSVRAEKEAPELGTLRLAIYLAEAEAGEVAQG